MTYAPSNVRDDDASVSRASTSDHSGKSYVSKKKQKSKQPLRNSMDKGRGVSHNNNALSNKNQTRNGSASKPQQSSRTIPQSSSMSLKVTSGQPKYLRTPLDNCEGNLFSPQPQTIALTTTQPQYVVLASPQPQLSTHGSPKPKSLKSRLMSKDSGNGLASSQPQYPVFSSPQPQYAVLPASPQPQYAILASQHSQPMALATPHPQYAVLN